MDSTEKALEQIRQEWVAQGSPTAASVAARANMSGITVRRYLDGSTKRGDPAKVRALAIALGRMDIAESVKDTLSADVSESVMRYMSERFQLWRESNLEEINTERVQREASEKRYAAEVDRMAKTTELLIHRVEQLERDKEKLVEDKAVIMAELVTARKGKRKYERFMFALVMIFVLYFVIFDLPYPDYGITEVLLSIFHK